MTVSEELDMNKLQAILVIVLVLAGLKRPCSFDFVKAGFFAGGQEGEIV